MVTPLLILRAFRLALLNRSNGRAVMFEDSTFESTGRIHTRSRGWMIATFTFNSSILLALILIPLLYPQALPRIAMTMLMQAPVQPVEQVKPQPRLERTVVAEQVGIQAPPKIPTGILYVNKPEAPLPPINVAEMADPGFGNGVGPFSGSGTRPVVQQLPKALAHVSSGVMAGMIVQRVLPEYPAIPRAARIEGTVVLEATISISGTIEHLRVVSGPVLLQQAALNAVQQWRYRPYLLDGQPVEVETTVNVEFRLQ
jgi:protein TonB